MVTYPDVFKSRDLVSCLGFFLDGFTDTGEEIFFCLADAFPESAEIALADMILGVDGEQSVRPLFHNAIDSHCHKLFYINKSCLFARPYRPACLRMLRRVPGGISWVWCLGTLNFASVSGEYQTSCPLTFVAHSWQPCDFKSRFNSFTLMACLETTLRR
jgi:hypothetical protein